ncbi:MAG TPA: hypothetical protein VIO58_07015 [Candidatus Methanoperedens sp.]
MLTGKTKPRRIYGIDFSGSKDAGKKIWITVGRIKGDGLHIEDCRRASDFLHAGKERDRCLAALRDFIARERNSAFGLDFPFGLPRELVKENSWEDFILAFPGYYQGPSGPEEFRKECGKAASGSELKRVTDKESKTPFSPYNLRVYKQTYYGLRELLNPLVRENLACVLPMQKAMSSKPWILEICPSSTLKRLMKKPNSYKGKTDMHKSARSRILEVLEKKTFTFVEQDLFASIIEDSEGDALDSIIAAYATFKAISNPAILSHGAYRAYLLEGYVFC